MHDRVCRRCPCGGPLPARVGFVAALCESAPGGRAEVPGGRREGAVRRVVELVLRLRRRCVGRGVVVVGVDRFAYRGADTRGCEYQHEHRDECEHTPHRIARAGLTRRELLKAVESIGKFAATTPARHVRETYLLDCLKAVPASVFRKGVLPMPFHEKRWPQILAAAK